MNISAVARASGLNIGTLFWRLRSGWDLGFALETPAGAVPTPLAEDDAQLRADLLAGESSARLLGERYGLSARTIVRARGRMRAQGYRVRVPGDE